MMSRLMVGVLILIAACGGGGDEWEWDAEQITAYCMAVTAAAAQEGKEVEVLSACGDMAVTFIENGCTQAEFQSAVEDAIRGTSEVAYCTG